MNPIIKALQEELAKERNEALTLNYASVGYYEGHEAATARLLPIISEAVEIMYQIGLARCPSYMAHPQSVWFDEHVQSKAREFLTTLADASREISKPGHYTIDADGDRITKLEMDNNALVEENDKLREALAQETLEVENLKKCIDLLSPKFNHGYPSNLNRIEEK